MSVAHSSMYIVLVYNNCKDIIVKFDCKPNNSAGVDSSSTYVSGLGPAVEKRRYATMACLREGSATWTRAAPGVQTQAADSAAEC